MNELTHEQKVFEIWEALQDCASKMDLDGVEHFTECLRELELGDEE